MSGKHVRPIPRLKNAAGLGLVILLSGSIGAGVLLATRDPAPARAGAVQAEPGRAERAQAATGRALPARNLRASPPPSARPPAGRPVQACLCTSPSAAGHALAARISRGILAAVRGAPDAGVAVADTRTGIRCSFHPDRHFDAASIVKVIILAALLHEVAAQHGTLSDEQGGLAREMITESDNAAAGRPWHQVGRANLQLFLNLAGMTHTTLGPGILWGLTQVTAQDEVRLLTLLTTANQVLDRPAREYELRLMAEVVPAQRWGVPAGAAAGVTVHVKNGWLPDPELWVINSIGAFTDDDGAYEIVVLTEDNPAMPDGIATVQGVATVVNRALAPG